MKGCVAMSVALALSLAGVPAASATPLAGAMTPAVQTASRSIVVDVQQRGRSRNDEQLMRLPRGARGLRGDGRRGMRGTSAVRAGRDVRGDARRAIRQLRSERAPSAVGSARRGVPRLSGGVPSPVRATPAPLARERLQRRDPRVRLGDTVDAGARRLDRRGGGPAATQRRHRVSGLGAAGARVRPLDRRHRVTGIAGTRAPGTRAASPFDRNYVAGVAGTRRLDDRALTDDRRRLRHRAAFRGGHPALHDGAKWHFHDGRWKKGHPHWRDKPRFHRGRIWRRAHDGWFFWWQHAWFRAPAFGIVTVPIIVEQPVIVRETVTYYPEPESAVDPYAPWTDEWYDWCAERYDTFDPLTGYFLGEDGEYRFCVYTTAGTGDVPPAFPPYSELDPGRN